MRDGEGLWVAEASATTSMAAAGGALVYLRDGETLAVRNVLTGAQAVPYESPAANAYTVPVIVSGS